MDVLRIPVASRLLPDDHSLIENILKGEVVSFPSVFISGGSNAKSKRGQQQQAKNELCFSTPADKFKNEEFDFEKNLALFDKQV